MIRSHLRYPLAPMRLIMAPMVRIEQTPSWFGVKWYFQLYDIGVYSCMVGVPGVEPGTQAFSGLRSTSWAKLPHLAGMTRLELATSGVTSQRSTLLSYIPISGTRGRIWTLNPCVRSAVLLSIELHGCY